LTQSVFETGQDISVLSGVSYGAGAGADEGVGVGGAYPEAVYSVFDVTDCVIGVTDITLFVAAYMFRDSLT
jgi:hypothetical protein